MLGRDDLELLYAAHVLRDRRNGAVRRHGRTLGGRRIGELSRLAEYQRSLARSDPSRWQRWMVENARPLITVALVAAILVTVGRIVWLLGGFR